LVRYRLRPVCTFFTVRDAIGQTRFDVHVQRLPDLTDTETSALMSAFDALPALPMVSRFFVVRTPTAANIVAWGKWSGDVVMIKALINRQKAGKALDKAFGRVS